MKILKILMSFLIIISISCKNRKVDLPVLGLKGIQDTIYDHSKVWMFFKVTGNDTLAELNKNNLVANTHWIFNIDKRLSLKHVIPKIQQLQLKKAKPSMHDNGKLMHSYYSYVDTISKKLSFILFDSVKYVTEYELKLDQIYKDPDHMFIKYQKNGIFVNGREFEMNKLKNLFGEHLNISKIKIHLSFDENLSYQNYIHLKALLFNLENDAIQLAKEEMIN